MGSRVLSGLGTNPEHYLLLFRSYLLESWSSRAMLLAGILPRQKVRAHREQEIVDIHMKFRGRMLLFRINAEYIFSLFYATNRMHVK